MTERKVSIGTGADKGQATSLSFPGLLSLVDFLCGQRGEEVWWSCHQWETGRRQTKNWQASSMVVIDVDRHEAGEKAPLSQDAWEALREAFQKGRLPGHWMHRTPHGLRLVALLGESVEDAQAWSGAAVALAQMTDDALSLNRRLAALGLAVDTAATFDRARLFWGPFATVAGEERDGNGITDSRRAPYDLVALKPPSGGYIAGKPRPASRGRRGTTEEWRAARLKFIAEHPLPGIGADRQCPACGHKGCVNVFPEDDTRLWCWSTNHGDCGRAVLGPADAAVKGHLFDALDLAAHLQGKTPTRVLIDARLLTPEAAFGPNDDLPEVLRPGEHILPSGDCIQREVKDWAEEVLSFCSESGRLYRRGDVAQIVDEGVRLYVASDYDMQLIAGEHVKSMKWITPRKKDAEPTLVWNFHTKADGGTLRDAARFCKAVPAVDLVVQYPVFAGDDLHRVKPGYNEDSNVLYLPAPMFRDIQPIDLKDDLKSTARATLLSLVEDFPFDTQADAENAIAAMFTMMMRPAMKNSPLFYVGAQKPGTGKTMLCRDVIGATLTGRVADVIDLGKDEETEKRISSMALTADALIIFDNLDSEKQVAGGSLASFLTAPVWGFRILGKTYKTEAVNRSVIMANGNNNDFSEELAQRTFPIMLRTRSAKPQDRDDFKHPDLASWVDEMRVPVVATMMGAIEGWKRDGRPTNGKHYRTSRFTKWSSTVLAVMHWLGFREFGKNVDEFRIAVMDPMERDASTLITHWVESGQVDVPKSATDLYKWSVELGLFEERLVGHPDEHVNIFKHGIMRKLWGVPLRMNGSDVVRDFKMTKKRVGNTTRIVLREMSQ